MWFQANNTNKSLIDLEQIERYLKKDGSFSIESYNGRLSYDEEKTRDEDYEKIKELLLNKKGRFTMESIRSYFVKHQDALITLAIIILLDHFLFDGAFKEKIKSSIDKMIGSTEKKLTATE